MFAPTVSMTYKKQPLEVLNQLIEKRQQFMRECARDAVVATAIDALKSIRTMTRSALGRTKFAFKVEDTGYYGGYSASEHRSCVRQGVGRHSPKIKLDGRVVIRCPRFVRQASRHIYRVTPERREKDPVYYVCAVSADIATAYEMSRIRKSIRRTGGLARNALSVAMGRTSTRNGDMEGSSTSRSFAEKCVTVMRDGAADTYSVTVVDAVNYARLALKGGTVEDALARAANKVSGLIRHTCHGALDGELETPFPEIVRSR